MLVEFVRDKNGHRVGVVVAVGSETVGWSAYNTKVERMVGNKFDRKRAIDIAMGRANIGSDVRIPRHIQPIVDRMMDRSARYYWK